MCDPSNMAPLPPLLAGALIGMRKTCFIWGPCRRILFLIIYQGWRTSNRWSKDIKTILTLAMSDVRNKVCSITSHVDGIEASSHKQNRDLHRLQTITSSHASVLLSVKRHLQDLDNRGRRQNLRLRCLPESVDTANLEHAVTEIFNLLLECPPESPIAFEHLHRALQPLAGPNDPSRNIVCCLVEYRLKEELLRRARDGGCLRHGEHDLQL